MEPTYNEVSYFKSYINALSCCVDGRKNSQITCVWRWFETNIIVSHKTVARKNLWLWSHLWDAIKTVVPGACKPQKQQKDSCPGHWKLELFSKLLIFPTHIPTKIPAQFLTASFFSVRCSPTSSLTKMEGQQLIAAFKQPIIHARIKCCSSSSCSQNVRVLANQPALLRTTRRSEIRPYKEWFPWIKPY